MLLWTKKGRQIHTSGRDFVEHTTTWRLEAFHQRHGNRNQVGIARWYMHSGGCTNTDEETTQAKNMKNRKDLPTVSDWDLIRVYV